MKPPESNAESTRRRLSMVLAGFLVAGFFLYAWFIALAPLGSADLWFHLKNGQYILDTHTLPGPEDPYGFTLEGKPLEGGRLKGLRSQWLGQVVIFSAFNAFGPEGFSAIKAGLGLAPFLIIFAWPLMGARRESAHGLLARLAVVALPVMMGSMFFAVSYERPQVFSFLFSGIALLILLRLSEPDASMASVAPKVPIAWYVSLPMVMALWGNLHGGYVIGVFLIALWAAGEMASFLSYRYGLGFAQYLEPPPARPLRFFPLCAISILASGLHPGGFLQVKGALSIVAGYFAQTPSAPAQTVMAQVLEYKPLMYFYHSLKLDWTLFMLAFYVVWLLVIAASFWFKRRVKLPLALVAGFVVWFGVAYFRGALFALPLLALSGAFALEGLAGWRRGVPAVAASLVLFVMLGLYVTKQPWLLDPRPPAHWIDGEFPEGAIRFMREHNVKGPLFNNLAWGGYIVWRAWPDYRVFVDGRELDPQAFSDYVQVLRGSPRWREILDSYGINAILVPALSGKNGAIFPLLSLMGWENDRLWRPVYVQNNTVLLVRDNAAQAGVIECCAITHRQMYRYIADYATLMLVRAPYNQVLQESRAAGLVWSGQYDAARRVLSALPPSTMKRSLLRQMLPAEDTDGPLFIKR